jgi:hypothetical protein
MTNEPALTCEGQRAKLQALKDSFLEKQEAFQGALLRLRDKEQRIRQQKQELDSLKGRLRQGYEELALAHADEAAQDLSQHLPAF